jgi:hypothetical protein
MDAIIAYKIDNLIGRGASLLNGFEAELRQLNAPGTNVARDLIGEAAGEFAANLFGTRKVKGYGKQATKAWLECQKRDAVSTITSRYYQQYLAWFQETCQLLSGISINTPNLVFPGNCAPLLRNVKKAEGFKRLDTRIRHVVTVLEELRTQDLVLNTSLPKQLPVPAKRIEPDPQQLLHKLEDTLRRFIERELSKTGADWWVKRVPLDIRSRAESRRQKQETIWPWHPVASTNVMDYLDFSDYRKIILEPTNWTQVFAGFFRALSFVESRMGELEPIRNDVAHSRAAPEQGLEKLKLFAQELIICMSKT